MGGCGGVIRKNSETLYRGEGLLFSSQFGIFSILAATFSAEVDLCREIENRKRKVNWNVL